MWPRKIFNRPDNKYFVIKAKVGGGDVISTDAWSVVESMGRIYVYSGLYASGNCTGSFPMKSSYWALVLGELGGGEKQ